MIDVHNKQGLKLRLLYSSVYADIFFTGSFTRHIIPKKKKHVKQLEEKHIWFSVDGGVWVSVYILYTCVGRVVLTAVNDRVTQASWLMSEIM